MNQELHTFSSQRADLRVCLSALVILLAPSLLMAQTTKVTSAEGHYSVTFPAPAERQGEPPKTVSGVTFSTETYTVALDGQVFSTVFTSYQGTSVNTEKELQANVDNFAKVLSATGIKTKPTEYVSPWSSIPGIEFTCETDQLTFHGKFFVAGNDVWGIVYGARKGSESQATKEQFFTSLEINRSRLKNEHG